MVDWGLIKMTSHLELEILDVKEHEDINSLNCGVGPINNYLIKGNAYYQHMMKLANTKLIKLDERVVGYFTLEFKTINIEEDESYPCICLKYLCTDLEFQKRGIGTKILDYVVNSSKDISNFVGCRCLFINAITSERKWYKDRGFDFLEDDDRIDLTALTVAMIIDFRDNEIVNAYFEA
jgi:GNAT superfamily N-acetyltransferase